MEACPDNAIDVLNKRGFARPYVLLEHCISRILKFPRGDVV